MVNASPYQQSSNNSSSSSISFSTTPTVISPPETQLFDVLPTPHKSFGAFANQNIERGTLVICERPLFSIDAPLQHFLWQRTASGSGPTPVEGEDDEDMHLDGECDLNSWMEKGIRRLLDGKTVEQRKEFYRLANTHDELPEAFGIFTTNAISTTPELGGLFLTLSRLNSACRANLSRPLWIPSTHAHILYAVRDIQQGEELTWPYLPIRFQLSSRSERQAETQKVFGFVCRCEACELAGVEARKSAVRCEKLKALKDMFLKGNLAVMDDFESMARSEGLWELAERVREQRDLKSSSVSPRDRSHDTSDL